LSAGAAPPCAAPPRAAATRAAADAVLNGDVRRHVPRARRAQRAPRARRALNGNEYVSAACGASR